MLYVSSFILMSSQEIYLSPLKIEISPVVLHIISFHSFNIILRAVETKYMQNDRANLNFQGR